jgi:hypothetical protein
MAETLLQFQTPVRAPDGTMYEARACGAEAPGGNWHGWLEFVPLEGGEPVRSQRETTQPNRVDTMYWASGLTPVYLEGALLRALNPLKLTPPHGPPPSLFSAPAPALRTSAPPGEPSPSVLNPFSAYEKGEVLLRKQLAALSPWHLANIVRHHGLTAEDPAVLDRLSAAALIELIVAGVREKAGDVRPSSS